MSTLPGRTRLSRRRALSLGGILGMMGLLSAAEAPEHSAGEPAEVEARPAPAPARDVDPFDHGARGDGVSDDTAACQAAVDAAARTGSRVFFGSGTFRITDTLRFPSGIEIAGMGARTVIQQITPGRPALASQNWYGDGPPPSGHVHLHDFRVYGEPRDPDSHGIVLRDYYSRIERVTTSSCGGNGVVITAFDRKGGLVGGSSLVENRLTEVDARNCRGVGLLLGEEDNGKLTDGYLHHCLVDCAEGGAGGVFIGSAAGWKVGQLHTYGKPKGPGLEVVNGYSTDLIGIYIESYEGAALRLRHTQSSVNLDQINVIGSKSGGHAVEIAGPSVGAARPTVNVGALNVLHQQDVAMTALYNASADVTVKLAALTVAGPQAERVAHLGGHGSRSVRVVDDARVLGAVGESANRRTLSFEGIPLMSGNSATWQGGGEQEVSLRIAALSDSDRWEGIVSVSAAKDQDGDQSCVWVAHLLVTCQAAGGPWRAYETDLVTAKGFDTAPRVSAGTTSSRPVLTFRFAPAAPDGYGVVSLMSARV